MIDLHEAFDALAPQRLRRRGDEKWGAVDDDVLPLWVADMDYPIAEPIRAAMAGFVAGETFGYPPGEGLAGVREACVARLSRRFAWEVAPGDVLLLPGIIPGLFACVDALTAPGDEVLLPTPLYPWFARAVERSGRVVANVDLAQDGTGCYRLDSADMAARLTPSTRMVMMCNPHNPTGRVFSRAELEAVANLALERDLWIVSDELHADLAYDASHVPIASLDPAVAARTVTLYGPTKAFNIAGLKVGFAIAQNPGARTRLAEACDGPVPEPNVLAQVAARAAFDRGDPWLAATLAYLRGNRALVSEFATQRLTGVRHQPPEATYLAWLDFRETPIADAPAAYLLEHARVALKEGSDYGRAGRGFARLNFATSRAIVATALDRIGRALEAA